MLVLAVTAVCSLTLHTERHMYICMTTCTLWSLLLLQALKINVDMLKLIQLGLTFTDAEGNLPVCNGEHTVWQFNFRGFRMSEDVYAQDSIELLKQSGIDFAQNEVSEHICMACCS